LQALARNEERVFDPSRKDHHWGMFGWNLIQTCIHMKEAAN